MHADVTLQLRIWGKGVIVGHTFVSVLTVTEVFNGNTLSSAFHILIEVYSKSSKSFVTCFEHSCTIGNLITLFPFALDSAPPEAESYRQVV